MNKRQLYVLLLSFLLLQLACSSGNEVTGGSNQTDNAKVLISAVYPSGEAASGASITIRPRDYISDGVNDTISLTLLNDSGKYFYEILDTGTYLLEIRDSLNNSAISELLITDTTDTLILDNDTLLAPGSISGKFETDGYSGFIAIPGTEHFLNIDSTGDFKFDNIPQFNRYSLYFQSDNSLIEPQLIDSIEVSPENTTIITTPSNWKFEKKILINTLSSEGAITEDLFNYPLLVNLKSSNFNFTEAQDSGKDLRFFDTNGKPLNFEFEQYSKSNEAAIIWVLIPQIVINSDTQHIIMKWGNESAISNDKFIGAFKESHGFKGVWHFNSDVYDATDSKISGTVFGDASIDQSGVIGHGFHIYENNSYIEIDNESHFDIIDELTISAWVKPDSLSSFSWDDAILSKGVDAYSLSRATGKDVFSLQTLPNGDNTTVTADGFTQLNDLKLHYISGVKRGDSLHIYTDGIKEGVIYQPADIATNNQPLLIGAKTNTSNPIDVFHGLIDEVRISNIGRSDSWIKFSYASQKEGQSIITFGD